MSVREVSLFVTILAIMPSLASATDETIVNKQDTDRIFSFDRAQWESYARQLTYPPGWKARLHPVDTGTGIMALDLEKNMGLSVQPLFMEDAGPPLTLIVGSYYPVGTFPMFSDDLRNQMESAAKADLGPAYSVSLSFKRTAPFGTEFDVVEIIIQQAAPETKSSAAQPPLAADPLVVKCEEPLPEFTLGADSHPSQTQVVDLCACIWGRLEGWEEETSRAISEGREGEVSSLNLRAFLGRFGSAAEGCGGNRL